MTGHPAPSFSKNLRRWVAAISAFLLMSVGFVGILVGSTNIAFFFLVLIMSVHWKNKCFTRLDFSYCLLLP